MRVAASPLLVLALAACGATASSSAPPAPVSTTISMAGSGGTGGSLGSGTFAVTTSPDAGITTANFPAPPDRVFAVLQDVYPQVGIAVGTLDTSTRMVGNRRLEVSRRLGTRPLSAYLRCGETAFGAPAADQNRVRLNIVSTVRAAASGEGSVVETNLQATSAAPGQSATTPCTTTGVLETAISNGVKLKLGGG